MLENCDTITFGRILIPDQGHDLLGSSKVWCFINVSIISWQNSNIMYLRRFCSSFCDINFYIIFDYGMNYFTLNIIGKSFTRGLKTLRVHHQHRGKCWRNHENVIMNRGKNVCIFVKNNISLRWSKSNFLVKVESVIFVLIWNSKIKIIDEQ